jgi:hypothetical protein
MSFVNSKTVNRQIIDRSIKILGIGLLLTSSMGLKTLAQSDPAVAIDRILRYESSSAPGGNTQGALISGLKKWLGAYQRILKEDNHYTAVFDRASLPLILELKESGDFKTFSFGCPITRSISTSDAPKAFQQILSKCNGFKF